MMFDEFMDLWVDLYFFFNLVHKKRNSEIKLMLVILLNINLKIIISIV